MFIYNVTVNISSGAHDEWLAWMREIHIPEVMETGCFVSHRILKVLNVDDEGQTYSIQYSFLQMSDIEKYASAFAPGLQAKHKEKFGENYAAFRTLLEEV